VYSPDLSRAELVPSDMFKVKKLNPKKYYNALQSYYYECLNEEPIKY